jgi:hypothetical protein
MQFSFRDFGSLVSLRGFGAYWKIRPVQGQIHPGTRGSEVEGEAGEWAGSLHDSRSLRGPLHSHSSKAAIISSTLAQPAWRGTALSRAPRLYNDFDCGVSAENHVVTKVLLRIPMSNAPPDLAKKVKAKVVGQVSEIADQVGSRVVATSAALLKNRDSPAAQTIWSALSVMFPPGLKRRVTSQVSFKRRPAPTCQTSSSMPATRE